MPAAVQFLDKVQNETSMQTTLVRKIYISTSI